jgi:hypothetical protein
MEQEWEAQGWLWARAAQGLSLLRPFRAAVAGRLVLLTLQMKYNLLSVKRDTSFLERLKEIPRIAAVF